MNTPDYAAEFAHAKRLAEEAIESIDSMTISETLPDEIYSEEAVERILKLISCLDVEVTAQTEIAYLEKGRVR